MREEKEEREREGQTDLIDFTVRSQRMRMMGVGMGMEMGMGMGMGMGMSCVLMQCCMFMWHYSFLIFLEHVAPIVLPTSYFSTSIYLYILVYARIY